jgi:hypothetical protein
VARAQREAQTAAIQQKAALEQQAAQRAAANEAELQQLQSIPLEQMNQAQQLRLMELNKSEATRAFIARQIEQVPATVLTNRVRGYAGIANALMMNPEIGVRRLRTLAEAEPNPEEKKALETAAEIAAMNPLFGARMLHGFMVEIGTTNKEVQGYADAVVNFLERSGNPLYPKEPGKPLLVPPNYRVLQDGQVVFEAPPAPPSPGAPTETERLTERLSDPTLTPQARQAIEGRLRILTTREAPAPREPREPPAPIPVVDPATGQVKYVPREQAVGMTPPQFMEGLTPKERQKREALFPKAKQAVATVETTMGDLVADLENLAAHPGLSGITGVVYGRTPSVTPQAREAQALYDKIVARGGFSELQNMRAASPTGGALGNVSNQEGAQLKQAFAEIGREQATESVKKALLRAAENAKLVRQRAREAFEDTYEYRQGGGQAPAPGGGGFPAPPQAAIDALKAGRGTDAQFDAVFGPGAAARARGR